MQLELEPIYLEIINMIWNWLEFSDEYFKQSEQCTDIII